MTRQAIIVAGGRGTRMNNEVPKQFLPLCGKPIVMHTLETFYKFDSRIEPILVLPADLINYWQKLCVEQQFTIPHHIIAGGHERFFSVKNGLACTKPDALIAIHDGVRPFVSKETLERCFVEAELHGNATPAIPLVDSIREINKHENHIVNRTNLRAIQTPQVFQSQIIKKAFEQPFSPTFTDDASVVEAYGEKIHLVEGNIENIKITTPFDLLVGEALLQQFKE
ncbi:MAG TPA: 2-C-methyl-D-erythritol 4-phosphate cytidylyltransferase [Paludibacteraceae bacterium]|jgi:2-C-methyl-D-erythritol 4-phosphate cytidylyltransferase|nr:2-C-methyl-D-erythritol 4-phosphate cytidylyltransferase [Paludibacteraceae bacterium]HQB69628.1 2-C-methyl-D-erythritol 4-phosphate cytidylyltransferase [Paludibacteraceae bacterium]HRS67201.1 2-C-methyl-D-erythritol 4-phosphate cytidylyltransferase [Paludibacteraceae bacterium]